ncbi:MAG: hypothetical protein ACLFP8_05610 [Alphaproteobacteria bacterium]
MRILIVFAIAALTVVAIPAPSHATNKRCPRHQVQTNLKGRLAKTRIFRGTSQGFTEYLMGHSRGQGEILGFVDQGEIYTRLDYKFNVQPVDENYYCVNLEKVRGYFFAAPKLYMPTNYPKNSCEYKEVLKHERRHLQAVYDFHEKNEGKYKAYLGKIARAVPVYPPVGPGQVEQIQQEIMNYFENKFRTLEGQSMNELNAIQRKIDSPSEYRGVQKRCDNW